MLYKPRNDHVYYLYNINILQQLVASVNTIYQKSSYWNLITEMYLLSAAST